MAKLKDFITGLAKKAGYDTGSATGKPFFDALPDTDIPDDVQRGIDNSLISITDAKNNHPEIKNYYHKQSLDGMDRMIKKAIESFEFDKDAADEINNQETTYAKLPVLTSKIVELYEKKAQASPGKDKAVVQKEIDELHKQLAAEKINREKDKRGFDDEVKTMRINSKLSTHLSAFKTIHDEQDPEVRGTIINTFLQKELQDNKAKFDLDEHGNVVLLKSDGTNYYGENHQQVTPTKFIEQTLAKTKQLKVSSPAPNGANQSTNNGTPPQTAGGDNKNNGNASLIERNNQMLRDYNQAMANTSPNGLPVH